MSDDAALNSDGTEDTGRDTERRLRRKIERLEGALQKIVDQDYRGNRSTEYEIAYEALNKEQS